MVIMVVRQKSVVNSDYDAVRLSYAYHIFTDLRETQN